MENEWVEVRESRSGSTVEFGFAVEFAFGIAVDRLSSALERSQPVGSMILDPPSVANARGSSRGHQGRPVETRVVDGELDRVDLEVRG